ncbi:methylmalonyl-CoA mutase family protein [Nocardioides sp. R-C-SC26]|uniref:methylmalonyl-CoA mutase family protein n=1 Tax=Nocardioides sp. R-C-SC26 TaxID=2870414 RepID=UPI001E40E4FC|nr:methylmalonyl-CoA mutase family protein [Nocardioides sp. R-C-SC26]
MTSGTTEPAAPVDEPDRLDLAQPEDTATRADWEAETAKVLRKTKRLGDDDADELVWSKLTRTTLDGIAVTPLGTPDLLDDLATAGRPTRVGAWDIRAHHGAGEAKLVNEAALVDLEGGVTSLWLGVDADTDYAALLDQVLLDLAPVVLDAPAEAQSAAATRFVEYLAGREVHPDTNLGVDASSATPEIADTALKAGVVAFVVDATRVHDRGASDAQELAYSLLVAARYLRSLTDAGVALADAAGLVEFRYAATGEQFPTIAKLRAARRLWARMLELSGAELVDQRQHAVTSRPMMSTFDPWVNMLRTTVAAFAAGVGGADAVTVLPFDSALGRPDGFARRIARNTSHLLIEESHVAKVADPAGGSYAVEKLTDDLAVTAWRIFGELEEGADLDALIDEVVAAREKQVATRKRPLTGVSEFPNLGESLPERVPDGTWDDVRPYGASFEALRLAPAARPVFLATLGTIAQHTARATFASNLFAAGGVAVEVAGPTDGVDALLAAYAGQPVVCLAGSDAAYAEWGAEAATALRGAGATHVIIAGKAADYADDACSMGVDALAFLGRTREALA